MFFLILMSIWSNQNIPQIYPHLRQSVPIAIKSISFLSLPSAIRDSVCIAILGYKQDMDFAEISVLLSRRWCKHALKIQWKDKFNSLSTLESTF